MILMDGGVSNKSKEFVKVNFFSYPSFRKRFMKVLLDLLENDIGKEEFKKVKNDMYFKYKEGFYDSIFVSFWYQMKKFIFSNVKNVTNWIQFLIL